jgi:glycosyltransferase involved in cell wall biosynthesis
MPRLRFCMLTTFYPPWHFGGDAIQVQRLTHALAERGHEVTVVCSPSVHRYLAHRREPFPREPPGVTLVPLDESLPSLAGTYLTGRPLRARGQLERVLAGGFDVIHFHNPSLLGAPALFAMGDGVKLYTAHEQWLLCPSHVLWRRGRVCERPVCATCELSYRRPPQPWRRSRLLERSLEHLDALILPSSTSARLHERFADRVRLEVLDHFVPDPGGGVTHAGHGRPYFLYAGRLEPVKGAATVVDAFRRRRSEDLVVAGDGGLAGSLRRRARDLPHVRFTGWLEAAELDALYRGALAVVVPTLGHESFGLVPVEAFARGTPAIVHRFGSLRALAEETGAALAYETPAELDAALDRVATDGRLRKDLGTRARAAYRDRFVPEVHLSRYLSLIEELARRPDDAAVAGAAAS